MFNFGSIKTSLSFSSPDLSSPTKPFSALARHASLFSCFYPRFSSLSCNQDFKGLREVRLDSPSGSSNSSWSSSIFPSSEITSISSEQILTPLSTWNQPLSTWNQPLSTWNQPLEQDATGAGEDKMVWKETSFLGNEG
uniref:Uncharacterized protein n=1 Tax=Knipowitschia caucasica TaxID=637954 RepID=A0AAV2L9C5_KNICA